MFTCGMAMILVNTPASVLMNATAIRLAAYQCCGRISRIASRNAGVNTARTMISVAAPVMRPAVVCRTVRITRWFVNEVGGVSAVLWVLIVGAPLGWLVMARWF